MMAKLIALLPKLLPVLKFSIPLWAMLLVILPLTAKLMIVQNRLDGAYAELEERKTELSLVEVKLSKLSEYADRIKKQAKKNEAICNARLADREKIKQILKPVARKPAAPKPVFTNAPAINNETTGDGAQAVLPEIISPEISAEVVRFINAHLAY